MFEGIQNVPRIPELRRRLGFTLMMLAVYRVGVAIPTPGINGQALAEYFKQAQQTVFGMVNLFSGGALERFSIFALGIMPYISASIILQLMTLVIPYIERLSKEGEQGRKKITQYTRYGTVILSLIQGLFISLGLEQIQTPTGGSVVYFPGWSFRLMTMLTLTAGTAFIMWIGEQISERGIGNGISLIIFAGIVAAIPSALVNTFSYVRQGELGPLVLLVLVVIMVVTVGAIIYVERGHRRIPIQYAKRVVGRRMVGGQATHLPLRINTAGVIPPIFASSLLIFPATIAQFVQTPIVQRAADYLHPGGLVYTVVYVAGIIFFCYFYTAVIFNPVDVAENLQKFGGFIPGIRPGKRTAEYIDRILSRLTLAGAIYVSIICVLPTFLIAQFNVPFYFGGTALLIVVGVAIDTVAQMQAHLIQRSYDGFLKKGKVRGRR
ncbi:MAG: preprotein translocase subunit SecY [Candidatus Dadabacteria bacterium]|nr:MAG: preprotein translocase subunit SecY [Candidatus Dadabacteria bacterium]